MPHVVPLSDEALTILEEHPAAEGRDLVFGIGAGGFSGWSKAKSELDARIAQARKCRGQEPCHPGPCTICGAHLLRTLASAASRSPML